MHPNARHWSPLASGAVSASEVPAKVDSGADRLTDKSAAIVGGGPAGLLTAIMLARRGWQHIDVFDELPAPPLPSDPAWGIGERSYLLGINGRGQKALRSFGCMDRVDNYSALVHGRLNFEKDGTRKETLMKPPGTPGAQKNYVSRILQRDRLQACLLEEVAQNYPRIRLHYDVQCEDLDLTGEQPVLTMSKAGASFIHGPVELAVGADGVRSVVRDTLANATGSTTQVVRYPDNNERRYKTVPLHPNNVPGTRADLNWGTRNGSLSLGMDALPTKEGQMVGVLLFRPGTPVYKRIEGLQTAADAKQFFHDSLPVLVPYLEEEELGRFAKRPIGRLPSFQMVEGDIHRSLPKGAVVILGDSIKAVKPYFGQGCNSALEDVSVFGDCLEGAGDSVPEAATAFSSARAEDARALVRISRGFDKPGPIGIARFVGPLLLDSWLHKVFPQSFSPPLLRAIQNEKNGFAEVETRKRKDRFVQVGIGAAIFVLYRVIRALV